VSGRAPLAVSFTDQSLGSPASWQWDFDGDGVIDSTEQNPSHVFSVPGVFTVRLTASGPNGSDTRTEVSSIRIQLRNQLANISTRLPVQTGDNALIGGFIVTGTQPKKVIVRGIGPSLPMNGALVDPILELHDGSGVLLESNDNWVESPNKQDIIDTTIAPSNPLESAIVRTLPANGAGYTAILRGANEGTGIGIVEAYDLDSTVDSKLANISTRGLVQTDDNVLIAGTIVVAQTSQKVIVRAIGPSLSVPGKLADPTLELHDGNGAVLESNDNWVESPNKQAIIDSTIPPADPLESAIVQTLMPGNYTAVVRGVSNRTGIAVVEVYALQ
ncbi:MAG TPA: PKD domain-containing protein, partial [Chthoniobacterales bacterium]|nr:PKD domain-containing protein [Chthoniobacterales bacterium]